LVIPDLDRLLALLGIVRHVVAQRLVRGV